MSDRTIVNCRCNAFRISFHVQSSVSCNSTSNIIMIELQMLRSIEVICFIKSLIKLYPWNRIEKNVYERSLAPLGSEIIHSPKESINRDWNDEEDLYKRPQ